MIQYVSASSGNYRSLLTYERNWFRQSGLVVDLLVSRAKQRLRYITVIVKQGQGYSYFTVKTKVNRQCMHMSVCVFVDDVEEYFQDTEEATVPNPLLTLS